jgi:hypothetical protein
MARIKGIVLFKEPLPALQKSYNLERKARFMSRHDLIERGQAVLLADLSHKKGLGDLLKLLKLKIIYTYIFTWHTTLFKYCMHLSLIISLIECTSARISGSAAAAAADDECIRLLRRGALGPCR